MFFVSFVEENKNFPFCSFQSKKKHVLNILFFRRVASLSALWKNYVSPPYLLFFRLFHAKIQSAGSGLFLFSAMTRTTLILTVIVLFLLPSISVAQRLAPITEATLREIETARSEHENYREICRFFDDYLAEQSAEYRDAVKWICLKQAQSIDKLERISFNSNKPAKPDETVSISYKDPAPQFQGGGSAGSILLRNNKVFALHFVADFTHDCGCCTFDIAPGYLDDNFMDYIARITTLEYLDLGGGKITDAGLAKLAGVHSLKELSLGGTGQYTQSYGDNITRVAPSKHHITGSAFQHLHGLTQLEVLDLSTDESSGGGLWTNIKKESGILFEALSHYPKLKKLLVRNVDLTPKTMQWLAQCRELEDLHLTGTMPEPCLDILEPLTTLKKLYINVDGVSRSFAIPKFSALEALYFYWSAEKVARESAPTITVAALPELKSLSFSNTLYSYIAVYDNPKLASYPEPVQFYFGEGFTEKKLLQQARTSLSVQGESGTETVLNTLQSAPNTNELILSNVDVTAEILEAMLQMTELESLSLLRCTQPKELDFRKFQTLQQLSISFMNLSPDDYAQMHSLKQLSLIGVQLPAEFGHLPALEKLVLRECVPKDLTLVNLPAVTRIEIWEHNRNRGGSLLVKDAPRLEYFKNVVTYWHDSQAFEGCPSLKDGQFMRVGEWADYPLPPKTRLDLRGTLIRKDDPCVKHIIDGGVAVLLD